MIVILLTMIIVIGTIITFYFPYAILIAVGINELVSQVYRLVIVPRLKEMEEKEKYKEFERVKYNPIKKIISLLETYEDIKDDDIIEKKTTIELLKLFEKLDLIGFSKTGDTFKDENYQIHITRTNKNQFYVKKIDESEMYYSEKYDQTSIVKVLNTFIGYLREELDKWLETS